MRPWFKKTDDANLPDFWKQYEEAFNTPLPQYARDTTFIALDTETTGFDLETDRILAIGIIKIHHGTIKIKDSEELFVTQNYFNPKTVPIHGIVNHPKQTTISEKNMLISFLGLLKNAPVIAHHASFDIGMLNAALKRHHLPPLKNKVFDTMDFYRKGLITSNFVDKQRGYSLDEIAQKLNIPLKDRHTALGDAYITALIFLKLWRRWDKQYHLKTRKLLRLQ